MKRILINWNWIISGKKNVRIEPQQVKELNLLHKYGEDWLEIIYEEIKNTVGGRNRCN